MCDRRASSAIEIGWNIARGSRDAGIMLLASLTSQSQSKFDNFAATRLIPRYRDQCLDAHRPEFLSHRMVLQLEFHSETVMRMHAIDVSMAEEEITTSNVRNESVSLSRVEVLDNTEVFLNHGASVYSAGMKLQHKIWAVRCTATQLQNT